MTTLAHRKPNLQSFICGEDLSGALYKFVKPGTNQGEVVLSGAAEEGCGILYDLGLGEGAAGTTCSVAMPGGGSLLHVAEIVSANDKMTPDANGEGVDAAAGEWVGARVDAIGDDSAADDYVPVIVIDSYVES